MRDWFCDEEHGSIGGGGSVGGITYWGSPWLAAMICIKWLLDELNKDANYIEESLGTHRNNIMQARKGIADWFPPLCHIMWMCLNYLVFH